MRRTGRGTGAIAACLLLAPALAGCFGTLVRFTGPPGAAVRVDDGALEEVPCECRLGTGVHSLEVREARSTDPSAPAGPPRTARGVIVLLKPRGRDFPPVRIEAHELAYALDWYGHSSSIRDENWREVGYLKLTREGVPPDDPDVKEVFARAEERREALKAERREEERLREEEKRAKKAERRAAGKGRSSFGGFGFFFIFPIGR